MLGSVHKRGREELLRGWCGSLERGLLRVRCVVSGVMRRVMGVRRVVGRLGGMVGEVRNWRGGLLFLFFPLPPFPGTTFNIFKLSNSDKILPILKQKSTKLLYNRLCEIFRKLLIRL